MYDIVWYGIVGFSIVWCSICYNTKQYDILWYNAKPYGMELLCAK